MLFLKVFFVASVLNWVILVEGLNDPCVTPDQIAGTCVNINQCASLKTALLRIKNYKRMAENDEFVANSTCGFDSVTNERIVCCPPEKFLNDTDLLNAESEKFTVSLPDVDTCGLSFANQSYTRVVGGFPVVKGQYPWLIALGYEDKEDPDYKCGGSLISNNHVLTAAHCIVGQNLVLAEIGTSKLYNNFEYVGDIIKIHVHEKYSTKTQEHDIAILKVQWKDKRLRKTEFIPTREASTICLPKTKELRANSYLRYFPFVAGWGDTKWDKEKSSQSNQLLAVQLSVVSLPSCKTAYENLTDTIINTNVICAGYKGGNHDSCRGDSGGPLMAPILVNGDTRYYQIGIVSKGFHCAVAGMPGIYTRVGKYVDWIRAKINE